MRDYTLPEVRRQDRTSLIKRWFHDPDCETDNAGFVIQFIESLMPPDEWWETVLQMVHLAPEGCLGHVAAGPLENLLGRYGDQVIDRVEAEARADAKFARTLHGVYRLTMTDRVWGRVLSLRPNP
jgi:hypothetical protein